MPKDGPSREMTVEESAEHWYNLQLSRHELLKLVRKKTNFITKAEKMDKLEEQLKPIKDEIIELSTDLQIMVDEEVGDVDDKIFHCEAIMAERFDPISGFKFESEHVKINFNKSVKVIVDDKAMIAEVLVKNNKASECINTFYLSKIRSFIDTGLLGGAAHLDETIKLKLSLKEALE